jgi:hypothetical protein
VSKVKQSTGLFAGIESRRAFSPEHLVPNLEVIARGLACVCAPARKGAAPRATEQPIDISSAGRCFLQMLGVFAEFETNLRRERQLDGIATAKAAGKYRGLPRGIDAAKIGELRRESPGATEIARWLGIARASVFRPNDLPALPAWSRPPTCKEEGPPPRSRPTKSSAATGGASPGRNTDRSRRLPCS